MRRLLIDEWAGRPYHVIGAKAYRHRWVGFSLPAFGYGLHMDQAESRNSKGEAPTGSAYYYLFEENPLPVWIYDPETLRIQDVNHAATRLYGYTREEFVRLTLVDIRPPEDVPQMLQVVRGPRESSHVTGEYRHQVKNGRIIDVIVTSHDIVHHGRPARFVLAQDITERKRTETANRALIEQVQKERHRLDSLLSRAPAVVWESWNEPDERQMRINYVSAHVETLLGYSARLWTDNALFWVTVVHPDDRERAQAEAWAQYESGKGGVSQFRCVAKDGRVVWIEATSAVIFGEDGSKQGVRGVNIDITERKMSEEALRESEERYRLVERATNDVIWDWDLVTGELHHNDSVYKVFGYTAETVGHDGQWWYDQAHPEDRETPVRGLREVIDSGGSYWTGEYRFKRGDGTWASVLDRSYVMRNSDGKALRIIGSMVDVTEARRREEALQFLADASEILSVGLDDQTILESLADLVVRDLSDHCSIEILEQPGALHRVALADVDSARREALSRFPDRYHFAARGEHPLTRALISEAAYIQPRITEDYTQSIAVEEDMMDFWRILKPISIICAPLRIRGKVLGAISFISCDPAHVYSDRDLALADELARRASIALDNTQLYRRVQRADTAKNEFLAMLSHELRNPLGAISNALELIRLRGRVDPTLQRTLDVVERQSNHMAHLVDDLLDVSRITQGKIELRMETVDLAKVIEQAVQANQPLMDSRGHVVTVQLPSESVWLRADPVRLAQVISNLLGNAAKYTEPGGNISVTGQCDGDDAAIRVRDSGVGIPSDMLNNVFDLFTQGDRAADRAQGGLGIGLTVVKNLVALHGGTVQACSEGLGRGSEFVVTLPALPRSSGQIPPSMAESRELAGHSGQRILLVEDNLDAARTLAEILETWGNTVRLAHDGLSALEMARHGDADVVLMDIGLPGMDGYEVARNLREGGLLPSAVLVALTGYGQEEDHRRSREAGFQHHLVKPVDFNTLGALLKSLFQTK